ncbi:MAG: 5-formyltetrahydrofolate cyclo-ligase [Pseudidiomarina mangrovi]|nr:MAG: 5-formyltetrahydrofolate cyclo-ligase [Pseudidiomarina mangrovi]
MQAQQWRQQLKQQRQALSSAERNHAGLQVAQRLQALVEFQQAQLIASYASFGVELPTCAIHQQLGAAQRLALPVLHPVVAHHLLFLEITDATVWQQNRYGINEPELRCDRVVPLSQLQIMLVPLVGFGPNGQRLGMGGGYYDRTLASNLSSWQRGELPQLLTIGLGYDFQYCEGLVQQPWDVPLHLVVTPSKVWDFRR